MTKIFNDPRNFKEDLLEGYVAAYGRYLQRVPDASGVMANGSPKSGKVSVVHGGGTGHYPAYYGLVGQGMADASVMGDIFTSPSAEQVYRCTKAVDGGAGVLYTYGNYSGDVMNFGMAEMRCNNEGIEVRTLLITDDVASASPDEIEERRGIAGAFYVVKCAGASAARGDNLDDVEAAAMHANAMTRSFGIAFAGCTLPGQSEPLFTVDAGQMEIGLGIHGEPGVNTTDMLPAAEIAKLLVETVIADTPTTASSRAAVMLNGLGSTKYEELFVIYKDVSKQLGSVGIEVYQPMVGEFVTSLNMAGCSLSLMWLDDDLQALHDAPASSPAYTRIGG
jgi:dihydroxyacetone kinase